MVVLRTLAWLKMQGEWTLVLLFIYCFGVRKGLMLGSERWLKEGFFIRKSVCVGRVCDCVGGDDEKCICALQP